MENLRLGYVYVGSAFIVFNIQGIWLVKKFIVI